MCQPNIFTFYWPGAHICLEDNIGRVAMKRLSEKEMISNANLTLVGRQSEGILYGRYRQDMGWI
jgi:hypothetical protein